MEDLLGKIAAQSVSFAIRSGIGVVSSFAIRETTRYIRTIKGRDREELLKLQVRLETKISIISPAIDLVEIISARGNTSLECALTLTKALRYDIQSLGQRVADATSVSESKLRRGDKEDIKAIMDDIRSLLHRIEDAVPLINLAVTTSGATLSASIPHTVSPSRLLQASTLLTAGDSAYVLDPSNPVQVGMAFNLTLYMLFAAHTHRESLSAKDLTWKEVISKCRVKLVRTPLVFDDDEDYSLDSERGDVGTLSAAQAIRAKRKADEFCYELCLIEDLDDGRVHDDDGGEPPGPYEDVERAGIRARIPIHQIAKMFYTNSGKLLGIEESNSPILLLKRDMNAIPPRKLVDRAKLYEYGYDGGSERDYGDEHCSLNGDEGSEQEAAHRLPSDLDPEWLAFEIWSEPLDDDTDEDDDDEEGNEGQGQGARSYQSGTEMTESNVSESRLVRSTNASALTHGQSGNPAASLPLSSVTVKSNLSLLECLLRLASLQNFQQASHLAVHDELLNLFLSDGNSWLGSHESRAREREYAKKRIGFDPFGSPQVSGDEDTQSISSKTRRQLEDKRLKKQVFNSPGRSGLPRGRAPSVMPTTPKNAPPARSDSPGAQLQLEGSAARGENKTYLPYSYPSTPVHLPRSGQEYRYPNSSSKLQSTNRWEGLTLPARNDSPSAGKGPGLFRK